MLVRSLLLILTTWISLSHAVAGAPTPLKNRLQQAHIGDFIVTEQGKTCSLLTIRNLTGNRLTLEEITLPEGFIDFKTMSWHSWVRTKAPGHTSWTFYEIDLQSEQLIGCYSHSKKRWLALDESEQFLTKLLSLSVIKLSDNQRHKIGPPPQTGEPDQRAVWNPPLVISGKKIQRPQFEVWQGTWPSDGTVLAGCQVDLFFNKNNPLFPFPHWIEVKSTHYQIRFRAIDSGSGLESPIPEPIPKRPTQPNPKQRQPNGCPYSD